MVALPFTDVNTLSLESNKQVLALPDPAKAIRAPGIDDIIMFSEHHYNTNYPPFEDFEEMEFVHDDGRTVYNITAPTPSGFIAGRDESLDKEVDSKVRIYHKDGKRWKVLPGTKEFLGQDPFFSYIHGHLILGNVYIDVDDNDAITGWKTRFHRGNDVYSLDTEPFFEGPLWMKDIRPHELPDSNVGVFTRPVNGLYNGGMIGYLEVPVLEDLTEENLLCAKIFWGFFNEREWGGVNAVYDLDNGLLGVMGHMARYDEGTVIDGKKAKVYYPFVAAFDWIHQRFITRRELAQGKIDDHNEPGDVYASFMLYKRDWVDQGDDAKHPILKDVVYPGGYLMQDDKAEAYVSLGDLKPIRTSGPNVLKPLAELDRAA